MSELPRATRKYVVLGLLLVVAVVLAIRELVLGPGNRGMTDAWHRVLRVDASGHSKRFGLSLKDPYLDIEHVRSDVIIASGREILRDPAAEPLDAAIACADEYGYGFLLIDLNEDWDLSQFATDVPPGASHAAISIGDAAPAGMRISFGAPVSGPFEYESPPRDWIARDLALYGHPDLQALRHAPGRPRWTRDLDKGYYVKEELDDLRWQQEWLADIDQQWPSGLSGSLAGRWEGVRAVPVSEGVLLEITPARFLVHRDPLASTLVDLDVIEFAFVPTEALAGGLDPIAARRPCVGMRGRKRMMDTPSSGFEIAPDGRTVVVALGDGTLDIYRWASDTRDSCELEWVEQFNLGPIDWPSVNNAGELSWVEYRGVLRWRDANPHWLEDDDFWSREPRWASDSLLALLGWRESSTSEEEIMLLHTDVASPEDSSFAPRAMLDARDLFPRLSRKDPAAKLLEVHPIGPDTLLVMTKECPSSIGHDARRCLHRVRFRKSLPGLLGRKAMPEPIELTRGAVEVRTLGPIDSNSWLAIASEGTRAVYVGVPETVDSRAKLFAMEIGATGFGPIEEIAEVRRDARPRIGPDGRVVVIDDRVKIGKFGERPTARAFVLGSPER